MNDKNKLNKFLAASSLAIMLEVLDFTLYGYTASILANRLLPNISHSIDFVWLIFAAGLICRLIGTIFFSHIADKYGSKLTLTIAIILMSLSTIGIGCIPLYSQIGILAPILLLIFRCVQGFSFAPEYNSISNYLSFTKFSEQNYTLACSLTVVFGSIGLTFGGWLMTLVTANHNIHNLPDFYWRAPYIISGAVLGFTSLYLRLQINNIKPENPAKIPLTNLLKSERLPLFYCISLTGLIGILTYSIAGFIASYLHTTRGFSLHESLSICSSNSWLLAIIVLISAYLSDKTSRSKVINFALWLLIIVAPIAFYFISHGTIQQVKIGVLGLVVALGVISGPMPALLSKAFSPEHRYTGASIAYNFGMAIFGGLTPTLFKSLINLHYILPGLFITIIVICIARANTSKLKLNFK